MKGLFFYPLQLALSDMKMESTFSLRDSILLLVFIAVIAIVLVIINIFSKNTSGRKSGSGSGSGSKNSFFLGFSIGKMIRGIGLNHEQKKMLDFVFKTDGVTDVEKSLTTPALLDRHFRRAYRAIEQSKSLNAEKQHKLSVLFSTRNLLENSAIGTIASTRELKENTTLTLSTVREKFNVIVVSIKGENISVETPKTILGSQIKVSKGTRLSVVFFTKSNKGFTFNTRVTGYSSMHGVPIMLLSHSNQLRFLSQRRFYRRHTSIACFLYVVYIEGKGKKQRLVVDKRRISGYIADISVGGCSIKTTAPVNVGARLKIEFEQGEDKVAALGQVLRINRKGVNSIIHIRFLKVTQKSMNLINAFVYDYLTE
ncbi:MAG: PilZ domain-containing protein [Treponema sp.]|jgi:hypothetical protein|nr:PilZ domain-containing protein [Treponema sp.]